jgi:hypothetical protein
MKKIFCAMLIAGVALGMAGLKAGATYAQEAVKGDAGLTVEDVADRVAKSESGVLARMRALQPIVEVYIQGMDEKLGTTPIRDEYFLGQFHWSDTMGPQLTPLTPERGNLAHAVGFFKVFSTQYLPDGFAAMAAGDWRGLDPARYDFTFVRREFLGEARCLVFEVQPKGNSDGFSGRIWVEDKDYNVVRFNGMTRTLNAPTAKALRKTVAFHVDSWRTNVRPGLWMPSYIYAEEAEPAKDSTVPRLRSQVRVWAYELKGTYRREEFTKIQIDDPVVQDSADQPQQLSPVLSQRQWAQQAEENILERLSKAGLLAPAGNVDKVLETVANNLEITSNLTIEPEVRVRVLLTSPLESFTVGHTIVLSRGLIDVLPDEASLAMALAHELAHIVLDQQVIDTRFAFADRLMIPDNELLQTVQIHHNATEETAAAAKQIDLLKRSPYKDKLGDAGLFLRAVTAYTNKLPNLIQPHVGEEVANGGNGSRLGPLMQQAPQLAPNSLSQVAALPLGARLIVDPWTSRLELLRNTNAQAMSTREKLPLTIAPLVPYIRYVESTVAEAR